ncbi:glycine-tRNA ligase [Exophiala xenobiotica]|uniref:glycine--tRNA ligase n=1 Tax=Exophiala xenobiotica TaxID=348802 RepID=A0A0D2D4T1_9EURO|nr:glycine-tRNA ligase [Exophiala xenobiotica]KIW57362.1 glycine-tRNA ligase [Exophiala xenobiotica]
MRAWKLFSRATPSHFPRISCFPRPFSCTASVPRFEPPRRQQLVGPKMATSTSKTGQPLDRAVLESVLRRRLFYTPSFEIYGGERGLFDYGPPGCALQANVVDLWRKHFVLEEDMLEVDCTMLTPEAVLKTSGHVDKFADWMCKDPKSGEIFRADHLVEQVLEARLKADKDARGQTIEVDEAKEAKKKKKIKDTKIEKLDDAVVQEYEETLAKIDNYGGDELGELIKKFNIKGPTTGAELDPPKAFNLMFQTQIGPSAELPNGYLRPETAQGQFLNFQKLLEFNQQSMPFASASIGKSFRNEISPRSGLLRVREFLMAEIEHFVDPEGGKKHPRFDDVKHVELTLLNRKTQLAGSTKPDVLTIGEAVSTKLVDNETLGYFLVRIQDFLLKLGVDSSKLRFRQHMANEMAHYAADCWDAELFTTYGWIECVGCADRSAYDLTVHMNKTGAPLVVRETRAEPLVIEEYQVDIDRKKLGPKFRKDAKAVESAVEALSQELREKLSLDLAKTGEIEIQTPGVGSGTTTLGKDLVNIEKRKRTEHVREYTPNVIEPSFGIGRILYSVMEHVFWTREGDEARGVLSFPPTVAPTKVLLVPLSNHPDFKPFMKKLTARLRQIGVSNKVDDSSASIGKRYARNDELGTPFGITIDFQTVKDGSLTLRERDSTKQVRASEDEIIAAVKSLVEGADTWEQVAKRLPAFEGQEADPTEK